MKKGLKATIVSVCAVALVACFGLCGCGHEKAELQIFAANSLSSAMNEAQAKYTETHNWITFADTQYLGSGSLVKNLAAGSYADVLITAASSNMDDAASQDLIDTSSRFDLYKNDLVVVVKKGSDLKISSVKDIIDQKLTLCIGDESVPAGNYARQALCANGYYTSDTGKGGTYQNMSTTPMLVDKVGTVVKYVGSGDVQCGIAYLSDVYRDDTVEVAYTIPSDQHKSIIYPAAVTKNSTHAQAAKDFLNWCKTDSNAKQIWQKYGFALAS